MADGPRLSSTANPLRRTPLLLDGGFRITFCLSLSGNGFGDAFWHPGWRFAYPGLRIVQPLQGCIVVAALKPGWWRYPPRRTPPYSNLRGFAAGCPIRRGGDRPSGFVKIIPVWE